MLAAEQLIASCGESDGYDFWITNKLFDKGGWEKSQIQGGKIYLVKNNNEFDLKFVDASGVSKSARLQGGNLVTVENNQKNITIIVVYSGTGTEVYSFTLDDAGKGEVVWTKIRYHPIFRNGGVASAKCG